MQKQIEILKTVFYDLPIHDILGDTYSRTKIEGNLNYLLEKRVPSYSQDEIAHLIGAKANLPCSESENAKKTWPFNLVHENAKAFLENQNGNLYVRYEKLLAWRNAAHYLDQDLFITTFLADQDIYTQIDRKDFNWDVTLKTNNSRLHNLLQKGMAENHFHLNGSAPHFQLSWIALMNCIVGREKEFKETQMNATPLEGSSDNLLVEDMVYQAAVIRLYLFMWIKQEEQACSSFMEKKEKEIFEKRLIRFLGIGAYGHISNLGLEKEDINLMSLDKRYFQDYIDNCRILLGKKQDKGYVVDYAIGRHLYTNNLLTSYMVGERWLMYKCLQNFFLKPNEYARYIKFFHAYVVMKSRFRGEIIQVNNNVGFSNFSNYQDRKEYFIEKHPIFKDAIKSLAVLSSIKNQNIESLEVRITPAQGKSNIANKVRKIDNIIMDKIKLDGKNMWFNNRIGILSQNQQQMMLYPFSSLHDLDLKTKEDKIQEEFIQASIQDKYFYVFHYPKERDSKRYTDKYISGRDNIYERHHGLRVKMKKRAEAFVQFRKSYGLENQRVFAIDACANEIGCRPEVFAQAFRYMRGHIADRQSSIYKCLDIERIPPLNITYHVGEDFLDISDGLRAIDEANLFLNMRHGDRLGHAIALGIDVDSWYDKKDNEVVLPAMDIVDNIAWLIMRLRENDIEESYRYINHLEGLFWKYYYQVYDNNVKGDTVTIEAYNDSWKLRGNAPEIFQFNSAEEIRRYYKKKRAITYWERCHKNPKISKDIIENNVAIHLYQAYHYSNKVRERGEQVVLFKVERLYIEAVKKVQKNMQYQIARSGIAIETNPSSNYLISTFSRYDEHPILQWYNRYLTSEINKKQSCYQIPVCINTDDQGVFETLLENEYALMALALEKAQDHNGVALYSSTMIYEWLDKIREMGLMVSFKNNDPGRRYY